MERSPPAALAGATLIKHAIAQAAGTPINRPSRRRRVGEVSTAVWRRGIESGTVEIMGSSTSLHSLPDSRRKYRQISNLYARANSEC